MVEWRKMFGSKQSQAVTPEERLEPVLAVPEKQSAPLSVHDLPTAAATLGLQAPVLQTILDGDKFPGGFGVTQIQHLDYWTLRARSDQLFNDNLYARGLLRRLITNEISTGVAPESCPDDEVLGVSEDDIADLTENIESRFHIWGKNPKLCDWNQRETFGARQRSARIEALVGGDVLVVLRSRPPMALPAIQLVRGDKVRTPFGGGENARKGHKIRHGVETDAQGRVVAHWVIKDDGEFERIPAFGPKTGKRLSWLVFGTEKRIDDVRGMPLLGLILQSLKELDRYRDSAQRKAVVNSVLAMFIKKTQDKQGTFPITGGAVRNDTIVKTDGDGTARNFTISQQVPGIIAQELQVGEEPVGFHSQGTDINFPVFEEAIIATIAWANEIPPEILRLAFSNNYSASQAAINEFKIYLNKFWSDWGETFCTPIYTEWLISEVLNQKIVIPGFIEAWRDPEQYDIFGAWILVDWYGSIKPSTDMLKQAKGSKLLVEHGWSTNAREARGTTGTKFSRNVKRLKRENQQLVEALRPLAEFKQEFGDDSAELATDAINSAVDNITDNVVSLLQENEG